MGSPDAPPTPATSPKSAGAPRGSDGNHASGVAPTIDGPQGSLAHNPDEYVELPTLIERARVNARFIGLWAQGFSVPPAS